MLESEEKIKETHIQKHLAHSKYSKMLVIIKKTNNLKKLLRRDYISL